MDDDEAGDEAAARVVVAPQEDEQRDEQCNRHHHARGDHHHERVAVARFARVGRPVCQPLPGRSGEQRLGERVDDQCRDAEHDDLAEGIEAAEVHEDDIHHIGAAAARLGIGEVIGRDAGLREVARLDLVGEEARSEPGENGKPAIAEAPALRCFRAGVLLGRKLSASSSRMIVTTSTEACVRARSGAER